MNNGIPDDFNVIIDANFDPMAILHGDQKLEGKPIVKVPGADDKNEGDEGKQKPEFKSSIELSDEMLEQGFTRARDESSKTAGGPTGKDPGRKDTRTQGQSSTTDNSTDKTTDNKGDKKDYSAEDKTNAFATHYKMMVATGAWEEIEDFDGSEEKYLEAAEVNDNKRITEELDGYFENAFQKNPDGRTIGIKLFQHLQAGGRISDFRDLYAPSEFKFEDIESTDDEVAEAASKDIIRNYYTAIGWKKEKIDTRINALAKTGRLVDEGKEVADPYKDLLAHQQKIHQQQLESNNIKSTQQRKKINDSIKQMIDENKGFGAVKLYEDKKEKESFVNYLFQADEETGRSTFSEDLNEALKDPEFLVFTAVALRKKLHKNPEQIVDNSKLEGKATSKLRGILEGALLNKNIASSGINSVDQQQPAQTGKYKFDLENARVLS